MSNFSWLWFPVGYILGNLNGHTQANEEHKDALRDAELKRLREELNRLKAKPWA